MLASNISPIPRKLGAFERPQPLLVKPGAESSRDPDPVRVFSGAYVSDGASRVVVMLERASRVSSDAGMPGAERDLTTRNFAFGGLYYAEMEG